MSMSMVAYLTPAEGEYRFRNGIALMLTFP